MFTKIENHWFQYHHPHTEDNYFVHECEESWLLESDDDSVLGGMLQSQSNAKLIRAAINEYDPKPRNLRRKMHLSLCHWVGEMVCDSCAKAAPEKVNTLAVLLDSLEIEEFVQEREKEKVNDYQ